MSTQPPKPVDSSRTEANIDFAAWLGEVNQELPTDYRVGNMPAKWAYLDRMVVAYETDFREENQRIINAEVAFYPSGYRMMPRRKNYELTKATVIDAAEHIRNFLKRGEFPGITTR